MEKIITLRKATVEDTEFARKVHHDAYRDVIVRQFGKWEDAPQDGYFEESWKPETHGIIQNDGESCGYCSIEERPDHIVVHELVLSPDFQGQGIGSQVLKGIIEDAKLKGLPIKLQVLRENHAYNLYRKFGFKDTGSTDTHFLMRLDPSA